VRARLCARSIFYRHPSRGFVDFILSSLSLSLSSLETSVLRVEGTDRPRAERADRSIFVSVRNAFAPVAVHRHRAIQVIGGIARHARTRNVLAPTVRLDSTRLDSTRSEQLVAAGSCPSLVRGRQRQVESRRIERNATVTAAGGKGRVFLARSEVDVFRALCERLSGGFKAAICRAKSRQLM